VDISLRTLFLCAGSPGILASEVKILTHLLEAGGAGGRIHGRRYLVRRDGQVGAQRFAAALQHGVVVRVQDGLHRWFSVTNLTS
jgi:hypothetical protein